MSFSETVPNSVLKYSKIVSCSDKYFHLRVCFFLLTSNVDLKNYFAWFQLSVVSGSFNPGVRSLACGVNTAFSKLSSLK